MPAQHTPPPSPQAAVESGASCTLVRFTTPAHAPAHAPACIPARPPQFERVFNPRWDAMPGAEAAAAAANNAFPMGQVGGRLCAQFVATCLKHEAVCGLMAHVVPSPCCVTAAPMHLSFPSRLVAAPTNPPQPTFPACQAAKANRRSRRLIGSDAPLADFESLLLDAGVVAGSLTVAHSCPGCSLTVACAVSQVAA